MSLIIRIQINTKEIRCYTVRRVSNVSVLKPLGKINKYEVKECYSGKLMGYVNHKYDDIPERLSIKALKLTNKKL